MPHSMWSRIAAALVLGLLVSPSASAEDWRQWRGPTGDNHAPAGATAPVAWSESQGLAWATPIPGRGHSSPTLVGGRIYLTTADEAQQTQSLLVLDRASGQLLANTIAHAGGLASRIHRNNTHASPTVASDGQRVFALFCNQDAAWVTAFDLAGARLWQQRAIGFDPQRYQFGFGSSPVIVGGSVIVASDYDGPESGLVALDAATGEVRWRAPRPNMLSYSTPARFAGASDQLLISGTQQIAAYDAATGKQLWTTPASTQATCGTMVWNKDLGLAFASGGYPETFTTAVQMTGDHDVVWSNRVKCYEQSLLAVGESVYGVSDRGVAYCWSAADGQERWRQRLGSGGPYSSSPVLVDGKIYVTSEAGTTFIFAADPSGFQLLGENQLGTSAFATPTPADGRLYHRFATSVGGKRQEYVVAIGP